MTVPPSLRRVAHITFLMLLAAALYGSVPHLGERLPARQPAPQVGTTRTPTLSARMEVRVWFGCPSTRPCS